jgi:hypothetical protein
MSKAKSSELKRCTICRHWYHPSVKAVSFQKTCSEICRLLRRRRLSRARRECDLQDYRVDERARQRACRRRKKKKAASECTATADSDGMSRTGLQLQPVDLHKLVRESVDIALGRSRAALIRQLTASLADNPQNRGQVFGVQAAGHAPAFVGKYLSEYR